MAIFNSYVKLPEGNTIPSAPSTLWEGLWITAINQNALPQKVFGAAR